MDMVRNVNDNDDDIVLLICKLHQQGMSAHVFAADNLVLRSHFAYKHAGRRGSYGPIAAAAFPGRLHTPAFVAACHSGRDGLRSRSFGLSAAKASPQSHLSPWRRFHDGRR